MSKRKPKNRRKWDETWRFSFDPDFDTRKTLTHADGEIDEIVMDNWLHLERMGDNQIWLAVGDTHFDVSIDPSGTVTILRRDDERVQVLPRRK